MFLHGAFYSETLVLPLNKFHFLEIRAEKQLSESLHTTVIGTK